jgi:quercetin dioxygenase-like cupin family protein
MFYKKGGSNYRVAREGVRYINVAFGERTHLTEFRLAGGSIIPMHSHPQEQTGYLVSGRMRFMIGGETFEAEAGDGWNIGGGIEHSVDVHEGCLVIEVFSPVRQDYL